MNFHWFLWEGWASERAEPISIIITGGPRQTPNHPFFHFHHHSDHHHHHHHFFQSLKGLTVSERSCHCDYDCGSARSNTVSISWCKSVPGPPELSCGGHLSGFDDHHLCVVSKTSWVYTLSTDMWSDHLGWEEGLWRGTQAGCNDHCLTPQPTLNLSCPQKMRFRITFSNPPKKSKVLSHSYKCFHFFNLQN